MKLSALRVAVVALVGGICVGSLFAALFLGVPSLALGEAERFVRFLPGILLIGAVAGALVGVGVGMVDAALILSLRGRLTYRWMVAFVAIGSVVGAAPAAGWVIAPFLGWNPLLAVVGVGVAASVLILTWIRVDRKLAVR